MSESFLCEEPLIISGTYQRLLLSTWLPWHVRGPPSHVLVLSVCKAWGGSSSGRVLAVHLRGLRCTLLLLITGILMLSLLFTEVGSALFKVVNLFFKNVTNFLKETLSMMENIVFVLDKSQTEHEEDSR